MRRNVSNSLLILIFLLVLMGPGKALMNNGISGLIDWISDTLLLMPGIIIGLSFHEFGHAKAAVLCGDNTPLYQGRVTLDPRAHVDLMGVISLVFIHFGWGKPVMINPRNFRKPRRDGIIVGLAGIIKNFVLAVIFGFVIRLLIMLAPRLMGTDLGYTIYMVLLDVIVINISLMLFNLLPVPPLDGFGVITEILNLQNSSFYNFVYQNSMMILLVIIMLDIPERLLTGPMNIILSLIMKTICGVW